MAGDGDYLADVFGATELVGQERVAWLVTQIRDVARLNAAGEAHQLRLVAQLAAEVGAEAAAELAAEPRVPGAPHEEDVIESAMHGELQAVLGVSAGTAARQVHLAQRLTDVLPGTLDALEAGRLDLTRARALVEATEILPDGLARAVQDQLLSAAGDAPWDGLSPRAWRARVDRAVVRVDADAARRRREQAYEQRAVRVVPTIGGMAELFITGDAADVAMAEQVLTDLAHGRPMVGPDGGYVTMDQRRTDSFFDLLRAVCDGDGLPAVPVRRVRELGLVLHADTFFGDGPAASDPGEVRGLSAPAVVDPLTARDQAHDAARSGATNVLLVDQKGALTRVVRLPKSPAGGWTRQLLHAAITARLDTLPPLSCESYVPRWRSRTMCRPATRTAPAMTARAAQAGAISTTTPRGRVDRPT